MQLTLAYPTWFIGLCVLTGLAFALGLYFRERHFREQPAWLRWILGLLRFFTAGLLAFFLLSPLIRAVVTEVRKPVVVIAQDASESVRSSMSTAARNEYVEKLESLRKDLSGDFDAKIYAFGESVREGLDTSFRDKASNLSEMLSTVSDLYGGENLGAVILASDGIYNEGSSPLYLREKLGAPVYTVALGDTTPSKDLVLKRVFHNKIAYLGDQFSVQADISANNCTGSNTVLSVYKVQGGNTQLIQQQTINIDRGDFFKTQDLVLNADKSGVQRYRLTLSRVTGELTTVNNSQDIFVDVLDSRQKILLLALSPHPDLSAIRQSLSSNKNYEVEVAFVNDFKGDPVKYDFVILHQLPSRTNDANAIIAALDRNKTPRWFIAGMQTDFTQLNRVQNLMTIQADPRNSNDVQGRVDGGFNLFLLDDQWRDQLANYPPLLAPFGEFRLGAGAQALLFQRIRKIDTDYPLMVFGELGGIRTGLLAAEGIWRWRLFNYLQSENHLLFDDWMSKIVQHLSVKEDKRKFRVSLSKNILNENEQVYFDAELYNNSYELINDPDVRLTITDEKGKEFNYTFNKAGRAYTLNAGTLPVGHYRFRATTYGGKEQLTFDGQFSIQPIQLEQYETTADHRLLRLLSDQYGGEMVYSRDLDQLAQKLRASETLKPVIYESVRTRSLINLRWIFGLLIVLLTAEWFLRRYFGSY